MKRPAADAIPEFEFFRRVSLSFGSLHSAEMTRYLREHQSQVAKSPSCSRLIRDQWSPGAAVIQACQDVFETMQRQTAGHAREEHPCLKCLMREHYALRAFEGTSIRESYTRLHERYGDFQAGTHAFSEDFAYRRLESDSFAWGMRIFFGVNTN